MTTNALAPDIDSYWNLISAAAPVYSLEEQRTALILYRELAKGGAVTVEQFAAASGVSVSDAATRLDRPSLRGLTFADDEGRIVGFGGLAVVPMYHRFIVDGQALWTWCAWIVCSSHNCSIRMPRSSPLIPKPVRSFGSTLRRLA